MIVAAAAPELRHRLAPGATVEVEPPGADGNRSVRVVTPRGPVTFSAMSPGRVAVIEALAEGGSESSLVRLLTEQDGADAQAWLYYTLGRLLPLSVTELALTAGERSLAVADANGRDFQPGSRALPPELAVRISRFAYLHLDDGVTVLESPRSLARIRILDGGLLAAWPGFGAGTTAQQQADDPVAAAWLDLLFRCGFLEPVTPGAAAQADPAYLALEQWEFPDLLFHSRSREGRHRNPYGATYRFEGTRTPLPAVKAVEWQPRVALPRPDIAALRRSDPPFAEVLETRRSRRMPGPEPLTLAQLGEFLYRVARVRGRMQTDHEEVSNRPYPGGGADYELEIYLAVNRVAGLEQALWWYDPLAHELAQVAAFTPGVQALVRSAAAKAPPGEPADVTFLITGRIQRLAYKYQSIAYAIMLKNTGVLYQTMYLAATAMGLSATAVGGGDADLFAAVSGVPYVVEPYVGEFLLNSPHPAEVGHTLPAERS